MPSTPGAVGIFQFAAVTVLVPLGFTRTNAMAFILVAQAATYVVITALGDWPLAVPDHALAAGLGSSIMKS